MVGGDRDADGCVTLANCSNCQTVREERPARTHWIQQIWGGKASGGRGWGNTTEVEKKASRGSCMDARGQRAGDRL